MPRPRNGKATRLIAVLGYLKLRPGGADRLRNALVAHTQVVRGLDGCLHYAVAPAVEDRNRLCVSERWRDRAAQSAHLVGDHMPQFNVAMRIATVVEGNLDAYENGFVRKILELPAQRFRAEYEDKALIIVMGTLMLGKGEVDRLTPQFEPIIAATRREDGCELYAYALDVLAPDTIHIAERWRDQAALDAHFQTPQMAAFNATIAAADVRAISVKSYGADNERTLLER